MEKKVTAKLKQYRQSPRKVRLVANLVRGKNVERAILELDSLEKRASGPIKKLIQSAVANAKSINTNVDLKNLVVKKLTVDNGTILYRRRFRARGRAMPIRKRTSHIVLELGSKN